MRQHTKKSQINTRQQVLVLAVATCFAAGAQALPTAPNVVNGTASIATAGNTMTVTNSNGAIINWATFGIGAGETTRFIQPSVSSRVLNQVVGTAGSPLEMSRIYGTLSSNGQVWLVNPAGIVVGAGGIVDTAGFVASTLKVRPEDFLAGQLKFQATPGAGDVVNQGEIRTPGGGFAYLVGSNVRNEGIITTPNGETILAAGETVSLIDTATPGVKVEITGAANNATNLGTVVAEAGRIGIAGTIVRNSGTLNASSVVNDGGRIFLKASQDAYVDGNGRIVATGTQGGQVEVLGNRVAVMDNAAIDASGTNGGGTILVGGDYQGKNAAVQNATVTYFGPNATLKANATDNGDGGKVIVWADDTTRAYGRIEAKGGTNGGSGGFIETSGKQILDIVGIRIDGSAPKGKLGNWLIDPIEITIDDAYWSTILTALSSVGTTVSATYDIYFSQTTPWVAPGGYSGQLTFSSSAGSIYGNWGGSPSVQPSTGLNLKINNALSFSAAGNIFLGNGTVETTSGNISLTSTTGSVGIGKLKTPNGVTINARYSIWDDNWQSTGAAGINIEAGGAVSLTSLYGADPYSTCSPAPCYPSAISTDIYGGALITATVAYGADPLYGNAPTFGDIGIRHAGIVPSTVNLSDYSGTPGRNGVEFFTASNLDTSAGKTFYTNGGWVFLGSDGNLTYNGGIGGTPSEVGMYAAGTLTVNNAITTYGGYGATPFIGLASGVSTILNTGATLTSGDSLYGGDVGLVAGASKTLMEGFNAVDSASSFFSLFAGVGGTLTVNSNISAGSDVGMVAGNITIGNGSTITTYSSLDHGILAYASNQLDMNGMLNSAANVGLVAGSTLNVTGDIYANGTVGLLAGLGASTQLNIDTPESLSSYFAATGSSVNLSGSYVSGDYVGILANDINLTSSHVYGYYDAAVMAANNITLTGSSIGAGYETYIGLMGATSTLAFNSGSEVYAQSMATIYVDFYGRSSGGITIDGIDATTADYGSIFFNLGQPATLGNGLFITYAVTQADPCALSPELCKPPEPTDICASNPAACTLPPIEGGDNGLLKPEEKVVGGGEGEFGEGENKGKGKKKAAQCRG